MKFVVEWNKFTFVPVIVCAHCSLHRAQFIECPSQAPNADKPWVLEKETYRFHQNSTKGVFVGK